MRPPYTHLSRLAARYALYFATSGAKRIPSRSSEFSAEPNNRDGEQGWWWSGGGGAFAMGRNVPSTTAAHRGRVPPSNELGTPVDRIGTKHDAKEKMCTYRCAPEKKNRYDQFNSPLRELESETEPTQPALERPPPSSTPDTVSSRHTRNLTSTLHRKLRTQNIQVLRNPT